ncbi:glucosaminidase domain-containing protein [Ferrovibrio sp.]|uniref:glucosaminidase domain-containing protein n=1 Tax=Ferrovibrio sp. TaxID=1917215 RepID=UPI0025BD2E55|nr:glucosaminidase domain-containing protein [Ferrovibrio sp.]MBX3456696.1 glucosaminidase domain-containing protein [Ferrovibrio sp.]
MTADTNRPEFGGEQRGKRLLSIGSDVRLVMAGIGLLVSVGMISGVGVGWMSARMLAHVPEAETQPVALSQTVQDAWDRLGRLAQVEWRLPQIKAPEKAAPAAQIELASAVVAPSADKLGLNDKPAIPPEQAARRLAEVKALSPHRSAVRAEAERTVDNLLRRFESQGFDLADIRSASPGLEVPRIFMAKLPIDLADVTLTEKRKRAFVKVMLPHILRQNERIQADRDRLARLHDRAAMGLEPRGRDAEWLQDLAQQYGLEEVDTLELLLRVDIVPPSLALAQSIEESGWGTSRFAMLGNAVYGQWTWNPGSGIVPENRPEGEKYEVLRFSSLENSVAAYMRNLNTKSSYREFREKRADMRRQQQALDSHTLASQLHRYSVRGSEYIRGIRSIMRTNDLEVFDSARLSDEPPALFSGFEFFKKS